ncbi:phosphatidic acid phosphatase-related protein [Raphidocelis subcapitata]|uniref:Phosphatidic acid phosphatase-related protein n=1 Tax=Raphidocelis subcapitata TaxID=307507 RepID=A0A2V0NLF9_9CHLO|nr:phosphatidic acid phosphatase-related protein [Raphidocelis subcapitata]|eukprot:GBF87919.1 phosphatidic acid phosphatase-related protein [Raphidocelis subcapitata]
MLAGLRSAAASPAGLPARPAGVGRRAFNGIARPIHCSSGCPGPEASTSSTCAPGASAEQQLAPQQLAARALVLKMRACARSMGQWMRQHRLRELVFGSGLGVGPTPLQLMAAFVLPTLPGGGVNDIFTNRVFLAGFWAWFTAQTLKIFTKRLKKGVWDIRAIVDSGGMPSSHSALCAGITTAIAYQSGLGSTSFAMAVAFSSIVMYDAAGVRRHAGKQAEVLNQVIDELLDGHPVSDVRLKEVLGHTPLQVGAGAVLGVLFGAFFPALQAAVV